MLSVIKIKLAAGAHATGQVQTVQDTGESGSAGRTLGPSGTNVSHATTRLKDLLILLTAPSFDRLSTQIEFLGNPPAPIADCVIPFKEIGYEHKGQMIGCWGRVVGVGSGDSGIWLHSALDGANRLQIAIRNADVAATILAARGRKDFNHTKTMYVLAFGQIKSSSQSLYCDLLHATNIAFLKAFD
jgi:hypothetical protein